MTGRFEQLPASIQDFINQKRAKEGKRLLRHHDKVSVNVNQIEDDKDASAGMMPVILESKRRERARASRPKLYDGAGRTIR